MTAHTPGPWTARPWGATNTGLSGLNVESGLTTIARLRTESAEEEANVRLIAAAPELLETLIECRKALAFFFGHEGWALDDTKVLDVARLAILKATGGAP